MAKPVAPIVTSPQADSTTRILLIGLGLLVLGHLVTAAAPGIRTWGLDYWSEIPAGVRWLLAGIVGLAIFPPVARAVDAMTGRLRWNRWGILASAVALAILFVIFRSRALAYGDGYSFPGYLAGGALPRFEAQLAVMWLDLAAHWAVYRFLIMPLGGSVELAYAILSALAGILMLWAIVRIATAVAARASRRLVIATALTSGAVALWFGYVEAYSLTNAAGLWALVFAIEAQRQPRLIWRAWALWVIACAFHLLALPLALPLAWATWRVRRPATALTPRRTAALCFGAGFLACALGSALLHYLGRTTTVPLWSTPDSSYTAFSTHHLLDALNQALLVAPLGVIGIVVWLVRGPGDPLRSGAMVAAPQAARGILAIAAASTWYFAFWVDPFLGAFRDWDLLAGFGIPVSLWGATVLLGRTGANPLSRWRWVPVAALAAVHVGSFVATLQSESQAVMRVDRLVRQDVHYSRDFYHGTRLGSWAYLAARKQGRWDLAAQHLRRYAEWVPRDPLGWKNLGAVYANLRQMDSAVACYKRATEIDDNDRAAFSGLGLSYVQTNNLPGARAALERAVFLSDTLVADRNLLAQVYEGLGMLERADSVARKTTQIKPDRYEAHFLLGRIAQARGDTAEALRQYLDAAACNATDEQVYVRLVGLYQKGKDREQTAAAARRWEAKFPTDPKSSFILGTTYLLLEQYDSAQAALTRTLKYAPQDAVATFYLATTFRYLGQPQKSLELAQQAARMDTNLALPWLELVYLADDAHDRAAAAAATREYLRRAPADSSRSYFRQFLSP